MNIQAVRVKVESRSSIPDTRTTMMKNKDKNHKITCRRHQVTQSKVVNTTNKTHRHKTKLITRNNYNLRQQ